MFNWFSFLSYAFANAISPGPNNIMSMSNGVRLGLRKAYPFNLGVLTGASTVMILCAFFCSVLTGLIPQVEKPMLYLGAGYILWLAWKTWRRSGIIEEREARGNYLSGVVLQFVNVRLFVYGILSMQIFVLPHYQGNWKMLFFFSLVLAGVGTCCNLLWTLFGTLFKTLFSRHARAANAVLALWLVDCAVSLFL